MVKILHRTIKILNKKEQYVFLSYIFFDVVISILDIGFLGFLLFIVNFYTQPVQLRQNLFFQFFSAHAFLITLFFVLGFAIKNLLAYLSIKKQYQFVYNVATRFSREKLQEYFASDYKSYVHVDSSVHIRKISQQPIEFGHYILRGLQQVISSFIIVILTIIVISIYDVKLLLLLLLSLLPPVVVAGYLIKKRSLHLRSNIQQAGERSLQYLKESLEGMIESKIFSKAHFFTRRYTDQQQNLNNFLADQQIIQTLPARLIEIFAILGLFFLIVFRNSAYLPVITIGAFLAAAYKIIPGIVKVLGGFSQLRSYEFVVNDLSNVTHKKIQDYDGEIKIRSLKFNNISFSYPDKNIISKFSLLLQQGDFAGISGYSGKGKTTLLNLLLGFLQPDEGEIYVNNIPFAVMDKDKFWKRVSYVKQQSFFIHDTAFHNVILDEENYDENRFEKVAEQTGFKTFINGSATKIIRENGKNISGGQRQRIAFARALYKDFDLLILDEPFSEMDEDSEKQMLHHLQTLAEQGKIIILITHNIASLSYCNKTVLISEF